MPERLTPGARATRIADVSQGLRWSLLCPGAGAAVPSVHAQAKDAFVEGLVAFSQAAAGTFGTEGSALKDALDRMNDGLARWDAAVSRVETGFAGAIASAAPREAAQMRATLGATYLERGRVADALPHLDAAASLDAASVQILRGLGHARAGQQAAAAAAFQRALVLEPASASAAMLFIGATRGAGPSKERELAMVALLDSVSGLVAGTGAPAIAVLPLDLLDDASVDEPFYPISAYAARPRAAARGEARRSAGQLPCRGGHRPARDRCGAVVGRGAGGGGRPSGSGRQACRAAVPVGAGAGGFVRDPAAAWRRLLDARGPRPRRRAPARGSAPEPAQRARAARPGRRAGGRARSRRGPGRAAADDRGVSLVWSGALAARPPERGSRGPGARAPGVRGRVAADAFRGRIPRATRRSAACSTTSWTWTRRPWPTNGG